MPLARNRLIRVMKCLLIFPKRIQKEGCPPPRLIHGPLTCELYVAGVTLTPAEFNRDTSCLSFIPEAGFRKSQKEINKR